MSADSDDTAGVYLDDCAFAYDLVDALRNERFRVVTPIDADLLGARDEEHFAFAARAGLPLITKNPEDFIALHEASAAHAGILVVYQDNVAGKDMRPSDVVRALRNLFASGLPIAGEVHVLNHWRF